MGQQHNIGDSCIVSQQDYKRVHILKWFYLETWVGSCPSPCPPISYSQETNNGREIAVTLTRDMAGTIVRGRPMGILLVR